jgi:GTP-binding protein Era
MNEYNMTKSSKDNITPLAESTALTEIDAPPATSTILPSFRTGHIAIIGQPNVGKSTLLNALIGQKISITCRKAQTTRHQIMGILTEDQTQYIFVDTPGFQTKHTNALNVAMNHSVKHAMNDVDVVLCVLQAGQFNDADRQVLQLLSTQRPTYLIINKVDLFSRNKGEVFAFAEYVQAQIQTLLPTFEFEGIVPVSAKQKIQTTKLLELIKHHLPETEALYDEDQMTNRNERFLASEIIREKVFRLTGDELPYGCAVDIEKYEQRGELRAIYAAIIVEKDNHKGMVIGSKGAKLKEIASAARSDMEKLFGSKVYLELWVKVRAGWLDKEGMVRSLGYLEH